MGTEQHFHMVQAAHLIMVNGNQSHLPQSLTLHAIVNNISQAIELGTLGQLFLGFLDGGGHSEAEATAVVDFNL
jgi:hypothetical protein